MQNIHGQDTSVNAMTEVALGLSMAFFSLLILALISISIPEAQVAKTSEEEKIAPLLLKKTIELSAKDKEDNEVVPPDVNTPQFAFYVKGKLFDQELQLRTFSSFDKTQRLVIAVEKNISFSEVYELKSAVNHPELSITMINQQWLERLNDK